MPRGDLGRIGIIPACAGNTVFDALTHDDVPLHEHFERQRARFAEVATARDLVPLRGLELVRLDGRQLLEQHRKPLFGNKKAAPKDGLRGGRICTYVSSIKGTPRTVLLSVLLIFPYVRHPINHGPLVRREPCCALRRIGIIPACAGNTACGSSCTPAPGDHPRACGEHGGKAANHADVQGSSPRVRGTHEDAVLDVISLGIIPACAGNTIGPSAGSCGGRNHPRVCGEHPMSTPMSAPAAGSSPCVRGTHFNRAREGRVFGIIPACAGNTGACPSRRCAPGDHPRVCGEHPEKVQAVEADAGSSPRVRGTLFEHGLPHGIHGIIPACAGNTLRSKRQTCRMRDHPRVCGEHFVKLPNSISVYGSSPRVRGTHIHVRGFGKQHRIIPACAGNTT